MNKAVISLLLPLALTGCALQSGQEEPPLPAPVTEDQLEASLNSLESRLTATMFNQNTQLSANHHAYMKALQQEIRSLKKRIVTPPPSPTQQPPASPAAKNTDDYPHDETRDGKLIVGETEDVWLEAVNDIFPARIDTGATTSSLSAKDITVFERDGKRWVSFSMAHEGVAEELIVETPLVRRVRIRQASADDSERRPVVALTMRIGRLSEKTEFTLTDRSQMSYPILLGREFLKDIAVVDIARQNVQGTPRRPKASE
ncbi:ATP-dependent zinc protease family protein [Zobellella maritima]|uniref:ATP-dependent zinc protease family protein n=1 Tax=Zobellella maritima TaxID=2059725 RepID=UPI000E3034B0|nr:ATP-dependent zinc protease [Zobellella maritima]